MYFFQSIINNVTSVMGLNTPGAILEKCPTLQEIAYAGSCVKVDSVNCDDMEHTYQRDIYNCATHTLPQFMLDCASAVCDLSSKDRRISDIVVGSGLAVVCISLVIYTVYQRSKTESDQPRTDYRTLNDEENQLECDDGNIPLDELELLNSDCQDTAVDDNAVASDDEGDEASSILKAF